jgi:protein ImuB
MVVVAKQNNTLQICALDEAAAKRGLDAGQPLANALAICPDLDVLDEDAAADRALLESIADWCDRFTPLVALDPPHGLWLDVTGCAHLFGGEAALLDSVCAGFERQGFAVRVAIAGTAVCARALTRHGLRTIVPAGGEAAAVSALPISTLGADPKIVQGLRRAGLKTIGEVASRAGHELAARFGAGFTALLGQAVGQHDAPISPRRPVPDYVAEKRFAEPVATAGVIQATLLSLTDILIDAVQRHGKGARQLSASFFRADGMVRTIVVDAGQVITRRESVMRLYAEKIDALSDPLDPGFGFDLIRLSVTRTAGAEPMQRGFDTNAHEAGDVAELADRLAARLGTRRVVRYIAQDTHIPERAALALPLLHCPFGANEAAWPSRIDSEPPLRPLRLLNPSEPIDVLAMFPDGPPAQFEWRRVRHRVAYVEGPERIAMDWWRLADADSEDHTRDYFRVESKDGARFWLYRRGIYIREVRSFRWFMQGLFA